jgi:hypothetical protein
MVSATTRATMVGNKNGARIVFRDKGRLSNRKSQVAK